MPVIPLAQQLGLDRDPLDRAALADQTVLVAEGGSVGQLPVQIFFHCGQILWGSHRGHPVAHGGELLPGIAEDIKETIVGVDDGKALVEPAAEHRAGDVVVQV